MYRRVGVSAFANRHQLRRDLLVIIAVSKSGVAQIQRPGLESRAWCRLLLPQTPIRPIRRPADTLPQSDPGPCTELPGCHNLTARFDRSISEPVPERVDPNSLTERDPHLCESR